MRCLCFLSGSESARMLAKRRSLLLDGREIERTPLLIPSFSSKGFPDVDKIIKYSSELIDGVMLVSAYDLHYAKVLPPFDFPSLVFRNCSRPLGWYGVASGGKRSYFWVDDGLGM